MRRFFPILMAVAVGMTACDGGSGDGEPVAATPTFSPAGGTYTAAQSVTISTVTPGATIYYTADGSTPTTASAVYGGAVTVSASGTLKAVATAPGYIASAVGTAAYVIDISQPVAATPTFSPAGGTYTDAQSVTISTTTPGATIHYTTDGSTPSTASAVYGGPVTISASGTLKAIATAPGHTASAVGTASYVINIRTFDGTWVVCRNDLGPDFREIFTIDGASGSLDLIIYDTVDVSCDGDGVSDTPLALTAAYGEQVTAGLGAGTVQATKVDVTLAGPPPEIFYTLIYRDAAAAPDVLHLGDDSGTLDGSTAALRPVDLQAMARALQTDPVPGDLTGEWRFCPANADGRIVIFDAATGAFEATKYTGTCATGTVSERVTATYTLAAPVYASFGATTVTAFAVDLDITAPFVRSVHTTFWVDTEASPRLLFGGDDALHGMDGSTASLRPRVLSTTVFVKQ